MKAIILKSFGGVDQLHISDEPQPELHDGEVIVQTKALSINPVDVQTRAGGGMSFKFRTAHPIILGWDIAGVIVATKSNTLQIGDEVFGMVHFPGRGAAYAEYVVAPADQLAIKPRDVSFEIAATTTLAALTAWQALHKHGELLKGQRILIHAASGGVGHFAVQLAKSVGAHVIGTSSAENREFVLSLGADEHLDYHNVNFEDVYSELDFVLDTAGHDYVRRSIPVIKKGGILISIPGSISHSNHSKAEAAGITAANILVHSNGTDMTALAHLLETGRLKPYVSNTFAFDQMAQAHLQLESHRTIGKVALTI